MTVALVANSPQDGLHFLDEEIGPVGRNKRRERGESDHDWRQKRRRKSPTGWSGSTSAKMNRRAPDSSLTRERFCGLRCLNLRLDRVQSWSRRFQALKPGDLEHTEKQSGFCVFRVTNRARRPPLAFGKGRGEFSRGARGGAESNAGSASVFIRVIRVRSPKISGHFCRQHVISGGLRRRHCQGFHWFPIRKPRRPDRWRDEPISKPKFRASRYLPPDPQPSRHRGWVCSMSQGRASSPPARSRRTLTSFLRPPPVVPARWRRASRSTSQA